MNKKELSNILDLIKNNETSKIKEMVENGLDIHFSNDYILYLAAFAQNKEIQKYFVDIGLDPELTVGRLEIAHPEELAYLRACKKEKEIREFANQLNESLPNESDKKQRIKI